MEGSVDYCYIQPFINYVGEQYRFYMHDFPEKERISKMIKWGYGILEQEPGGEYTIELASPDYEAGDKEVYAFQYIIACYAKRKMLNIKDFSFMERMMSKYKSKGTRKTYSEDILKQAAKLVEDGESIRSLSRKMGIEKMFLCRYLNKQKLKASPKKPGHPTALPFEEEKRLADYLKVLAKWGFAMSRNEVRLLVQEYVEANGLTGKVPFTNGLPGSYWFRAFCHRQKLSLKKMEALEKSRRNATKDPFIIYSFYDSLEHEMKRLELTDKPKHIFNLDKTSFCSDPTRIKLISGIGQKAHRTAENNPRENTTVLGCVSANGDVLPPLIIFESVHLWSTWKGENDIKGTFYGCSTNGWMTTLIFHDYLRKFAQTIKDRPILLIFDGHLTHLDLETVKFAREENISVIKLPPHTTDALQPLDKSCFKPLKNAWDAALVKWNRENQRRFTKSEFVDILCSIWHEGIKPETVKAGFASIGIFPLDRTKYPMSRFDPEQLKRYEEHKEREETNGASEDPVNNEGSEEASTSELPNIDEMSTSPEPALVMNSLDSNHAASSSPALVMNSAASSSKCSSCQSLTPTLSPKSKFETILLNKIKRTEAPKQVRRRINPMAQVITSDEWTKIAVEQKKERAAKEKEKDTRKKMKGEEKAERKKTLGIKQNKQKNVSPESSDESEDDDAVIIKSDDLFQDIDPFEVPSDIFADMEALDDLKPGDFLLARFKGGTRKATSYRYVVTILQKLSNEEFEVLGCKSEGDKQTFKKKDQDVSVIHINDIIGKLPVPDLVKISNNRYMFKFSAMVDVSEA